MHSSSSLRPLVSTLAAILSITAFASLAPAQSRIPNRIPALASDYSSAPIAGSVNPRVRHATDLGPTPVDTKLVGMTLRFTPSVEQQSALDQLLADQQNPASPFYHQWLTPQQYAAQFGLSAADLDKISKWLIRQGFTVTGVAQGGSFITFDGTVGQAQLAFSTNIHTLSLNGEQHFANVTEASVPNAFAGVVGAITGLHDFRARPHFHGSLISHPNFTSSISGNHYFAPGDAYTVYDSQPLITAGITGANFTIAVVGKVDINTADIAAFRSAAGLGAANLTTVHAGTDPGSARNCSPTGTNNCPSPNLEDLGESSLDVEWAGAMAPSATILFVNGADPYLNSMTYAIDQDLAPIISTSYGECEAAWGTSYLNSFELLFKQANAQGQTVLAAAGDAGATDCEATSSTEATTGLAVDYPGSSAHVTSMGGTMFNEGIATGSTIYWNANSSSSTDNAGSAVSYIPEAAWNDASYGGFGGGGGGVSAYFAKPAWQVETGPTGLTTLVSPDSSRDVPDLAMNASDAHDQLLYCYDGSCVNGFRDASSDLTVAGGTSFVAPTFAGMLALIEQKNNITRGAGNINPLLYALGNNATYYNTTSSSVFHDVTVGNNSMFCQLGSIQCPFGNFIGFNAGTGYDLATGWGSVDLNNLATAWSWASAHPEGVGTLGPNLSATALSASSTTSSATNVPVGTTVTLTATVTSATTGFTTPPTGFVQFLVNNIALGSPVALTTASGTTTAATSFVPSCNSLGQQDVTAVYLGDANYQGSKGPTLPSTSSDNPTNTPLVITVQTGSCPTFSLSPSTTSLTVAAGSTIPSITVAVVPVNGFSGTVVMTASATGLSGIVPNITLSPTSIVIPAGSTAQVSTTITLTGITASLHQPSAPGQHLPLPTYAQQIRSHSKFAVGSGAALASLLFLVLPRRRRFAGLFILLLSVALIGGATGCGGSSSTPASTTPPSNTNPYAGYYIVTVTGTYTASGNAVTAISTTIGYQIN